jgi:hypothetical protein
VVVAVVVVVVVAVVVVAVVVVAVVVGVVVVVVVAVVVAAGVAVVVVVVVVVVAVVVVVVVVVAVEGREVDHPINRRVIALDLKDLAGIKKVILVAGGLYKLDIIRAVLRRKLVQVLITDEDTATALLE